MSDQRDGGIAWTDETWNPLRGCSRVSEGCRNCYAETVAARFCGPGQPYEGLVRLSAEGKHGRARWNGEVRFVQEKLDEPLRWKRPRRVFVNSMSDIFHESVPDEQVDEIFSIMAASTRHTFQVLTKRPERARAYCRRVAASVPNDPVNIAVFDLANALSGNFATWPLSNVWLGVSVEDQASADARIPLLLETPAAVRWVSYEPALGPVDFDLGRCDSHDRDHVVTGDDGAEYCTECAANGFSGELSYGHWIDSGEGVDWIVVGGESGSGARPFDLAWARSVIEQTRDTGCRVFVKQLGALPVVDLDVTGNFRTNQKTGKREFEMTAERIDLRHRKGGDPIEWPEDLRVREWPMQEVR